jgi:prepilin-type N-terminal cleavage/methylation domain-containing protein
LWGSKMRVNDKRGFTLLESTLVIIVIGMLAVISIPKIMKTNRRVAEIEAQQITSQMRRARMMAIADSTGYVVQFDLDGAEYASYGIFLDADEDMSPDDPSSPVMLREIPKEEIDCKAIDGSGFNGTIAYSPLGRISNDPPFTSDNIILVTDGEKTINIGAVVATGRVFFN